MRRGEHALFEAVTADRVPFLAVAAGAYAAVIEHSGLRLTDTPGIGVEDKAELHRVFRALHSE